MRSPETAAGERCAHRRAAGGNVRKPYPMVQTL